MSLLKPILKSHPDEGLVTVDADTQIIAIPSEAWTPRYNEHGRPGRCVRVGLQTQAITEAMRTARRE